MSARRRGRGGGSRGASRLVEARARRGRDGKDEEQRRLIKRTAHHIPGESGHVFVVAAEVERHALLVGGELLAAVLRLARAEDELEANCIIVGPDVGLRLGALRPVVEDRLL